MFYCATSYSRWQSTAPSITGEESWGGGPTPSLLLANDRQVWNSGPEGRQKAAGRPANGLQAADILWKDKVWRALALDPERLALETDFLSPQGEGVRLVEDEEYGNDASLWLNLLDYCQRRNGLQGVYHVWRAFETRLRPLDTATPETRILLERFLQAAVHDDEVLESVFHYAEAMYSMHKVEWPRFYTTVIAHLLSVRREVEDVSRWHKRMRALGGIPSDEFFQMIKPFIVKDDAQMQNTLRSLYKESRHRTLYPLVLPELFSAGMTRIALEWRNLFVECGEKPFGRQSRHFVRFVQQYYRRTHLLPTERQLAAHMDNERKQAGACEEASPLYELVNRVHGKTFGIQEKGYKDELGARMLATSWIPVDMTIRLIAAMGVQDIGPLSLQSIALRADSVHEVLQKIQELEQLKVGLGSSVYSQAIRHFAERGQQGDLDDLVGSDMHPDMFENSQQDLTELGSDSSAAAQKARRIVIAARVAASSETAAAAWNQLLHDAVPTADAGNVLRLLDDMAVNNIPVAPAVLTGLGHSIQAEFFAQVGGFTTERLEYIAGLCHRAISRSYLPPRALLWVVLYALGRQHFLRTLETLSLHILAQFKLAPSPTRSNRLLAHTSYDQSKSSDLTERFDPFPEDLPFKHISHPIQLIFNRSLQQNIVTWGFSWALAGSERVQAPSYPYAKHRRPRHYYFARGIRLLALLRNAGVNVNPKLVRDTTLTRFAELYEDGLFQRRRVQTSQRRNRLSLQRARELCEAAWGQPYLDPTDRLAEIIRHHKGLTPRSLR
jgi:hypothetical protein